MTAPPRWEPDTQMVAAVMAMPKASRAMTELSDLDRCWLVAGLTLGGMTADEIASRTNCSRRLVMTIRAEGLTQDFKVAELVAHALGDELHAERGQHAVTRRELSEARAEAGRLRTQLGQVLGLKVAGGEVPLCRKGVHPMVDRNKYERNGKVYCRACRLDWDRENRAKHVA